MIAAAILAACSPQAPASQPIVQDGSQQGLREIPLTIRSAARVHRFTVEVAVTPQEQSAGLMYRKAVPPGRGMLFPFPYEQNAGFWMKNTLIPLDLIFIRADGTIARITTAEPLSLTSVTSGEPVLSVLEIAGGRAAELGIVPGDKVDFTL